MEIHISLAPEKLGQIGPVAITNSMLMMFIVMALLILVFGLIARNAKPVPGRAQGIFELIAEFLLNLVEGTGGKELGRRVFPLVGALFIYIAFANYTGILPGVGTIYIEESHAAADAGHAAEGAATEDGHEAPAAEGVADDEHAAPAAEDAEMVVESEGAATEGGSALDAETEGEGEAEAGGHERVTLMRPPNADINMTLAMSVLTFSIVQIAGIRAHGVVGRIKHMANPPFLFPIEVVSEFSRIISLSARLFGNIFAGEVLLGVIYAMVNAIKIAVVPLVLPVVFIGLELMFGTIQALVFALLTLIYIALAAAHDHGHGEEHHHEEAHLPATAHAPAGAAD